MFDDGFDGDTPEDTSDEDIPAAPPSPPPRQPSFSWPLYNGHLAPDFDGSASCSMGIVIGGISALADMFADFCTKVPELFQGLNDYLDRHEDAIAEALPYCRRRGHQE